MMYQIIEVINLKEERPGPLFKDKKEADRECRHYNQVGDYFYYVQKINHEHKCMVLKKK